MLQETATMKDVRGWFLPEFDTHFQDFLIRGRNHSWEYQEDTRHYALSFVKDFNSIALDIGGNVGFWTKELCQKFTHVHAFEPHPDNIKCFTKNMRSFSNYTLYPLAVSNKEEKDLSLFQSPDECGNVGLSSQGVETGNSSKTVKAEDLKTFKVDSVTLDSCNFNNIGFIKVDVQGYEKQVMQGCIDTLKANDCVVCLELPVQPNRVNFEAEKREHDEVVEMLYMIGYKRRGNLRKETIFTK